jgi:hypothetical protein
LPRNGRVAHRLHGSRSSPARPPDTPRSTMP